MFHTKNGLFFERVKDGGVHIIKRVNGKDDSPIITEETLDSYTWASVVASVCATGENGDTFRRAEYLHQDRAIRKSE